MKTIKHSIILLVGLAPLFQGLYFLYETYAYTIGLLVVLGIIVYKAHEIKLPTDPVFIILLLISLMQFLVGIYAVDRGMTVFGGLKYFSYVVFYIVLTQIYDNELKEKLIQSFIISIFLISSTSIIALFSESIYNYVFQYNRFGGLIQYANTYGVLAIVAMILILRKKVYKIIDYIMVVFIVDSIFLTYSRSILLMAVFSIIAIVIIKRYVRFNMLLALLAGTLLSYSLTVLLKLKDTSSRLSEISLNASEWKTRLIYYEDALEIIKSYPRGIGYQSYSYVQKYFRTGALYHVKFVHNNILQIGIEIGLIGILLLAGLFAFSIYKKDVDNYMKLAILVLFGHGIMDFDFQFPIVILLIIILGFGKDNIRVIKRHSRKFDIGLVSCLAIVYSVFFIASYAHYNGIYQRAYTIIPFYTEAKLDEIDKGDLSSTEKEYLCLELLVDNVYLTECYSYLRDYYKGENDWETSLYYAEKMVEYNAISIVSLEKYYEIILLASKEWIEIGEEKKAVKYLEIILNGPKYLQELAKQKNTDYNVKHKVSFTLSEKLIGYYEEANIMAIGK